MIRTCPVCKMTYCPDDLDDQKLHSRHHQRVWRGLNPKPMKSLPPNCIVEVRGDSSDRTVRTSPRWMNRQLYIRTKAINRELGYGVQWCPVGEEDADARGILFVDEDRQIVGAAAFRWRVFKDAPAVWALQWIWFWPSYRRQGFLARHWQQLRQMYGDFYIEPPVSEAMKAFVTKQGDAKLL